MKDKYNHPKQVSDISKIFLKKRLIFSIFLVLLEGWHRKPKGTIFILKVDALN